MEWKACLFCQIYNEFIISAEEESSEGIDNCSLHKITCLACAYFSLGWWHKIQKQMCFWRSLTNAKLICFISSYQPY